MTKRRFAKAESAAGPDFGRRGSASKGRKPATAASAIAEALEEFHHPVPRILIWDIETTNLSATFGTILVIGWKWFGEKKVYVRSILDTSGKDFLDDKALTAEFIEAFNTCDYHVTWYGDRFDLPMVKSKAIKYGMPPLAPKPSLDLWKTARRHFKLHSNRLNVWEQFLNTEDGKTGIDFEAWLRAAHGDRSAIAEVKDHCKKDVLVLEEVFVKMRPWLDNEPVRGLLTGDHLGCPSCGSLDIRKKGFKVAATRVYQQYLCNSCGRWFRDTRAADAAPQRNTA